MQLPIPSVSSLENQLELRAKAADAAENGTIHSEDTTFDDVQENIVLEMGNILQDGRTIASSHLENHNTLRTEIAGKIEGFPKQQLSKAVDGAVLIALRRREEEIKNCHVTETRSKTALKAYRLRYDINKPARYPEWRVLHWAIVFVLFFIESLANSQFFAAASPYGLVGGVLQASIISSINIGLGLMNGTVVLPWRYRTLVSNISTKLPSATAGAIGLLLLLFNLATAHYRVLLEEMPDQAIKLAIRHLFSSPFVIDNFDAWILLIVGIFFAIIACIEGYKSDDPLRDYGHLTREYVKAKELKANIRTSLRADAISQLKEKMSEIKTSPIKAKKLLNEYSTIISRYKADANEYREWRDRIQESTRTLLARYQSYITFGQYKFI